MRRIILCLFAWLGMTGAHAQSDATFAGTLKDITGTVQVVRSSRSPMPATSGMKVLVDDEILTAKDSSVGVVLVDGTRLSIGPNSQTRMSEISFNGTTQEGNILIKLYRGSLRMITGLIAANNPNAVKVVTPTSVVGIRGTDFIVQVAE